jgi:hypothetical protein
VSSAGRRRLGLDPDALLVPTRVLETDPPVDGRVRFEHQTRNKKRIRVVAEPVALASAEAGA